MATTRTNNDVHDNSTFANFANWATDIGEAFLDFGWLQSGDTGQVQWLGVSSFSSVTNVSGMTWRYAYSGLTTSGYATAFRVGRTVTITGFTGGAAGNNGTFVITSLAGGAGTFDVVNASGANSVAGAGVITKQTTVPSVYVNQIFVAQDVQAATRPEYVKMFYGNSSTAVNIEVTPGTGSDGAGNISGAFNNAPWTLTSQTSNNGATTYPCYFSGDAGEFRMFLWQTTSTTVGTMFGIERSKDSSGNKTTDYFSALWANASTNVNNYQSTGASGLSPLLYGNQSWPMGGCARITTGNTGAVTAAYPVFPLVPPTVELGNPMLGFVAIISGDTADGATITVGSLYAGIHTFIVGKENQFSSSSGVLGSLNCCPAMRYE